MSSSVVAAVMSAPMEAEVIAAVMPPPMETEVVAAVVATAVMSQLRRLGGRGTSR